VVAIQTWFKGRYYRSRTEARYAAVFSFCRLPFDYEKEGFWTELGRYLPDFYLPTLEVWFEAKGELPTPLAMEKCQCLADEKNQRVVMAYGEVGLESDIACFCPGGHGVGMNTLSSFLMQWLRPEIVLPAIEAAQAIRFGEPGNFLPILSLNVSPKLPLPATTLADVPF
jgi:hypothetical protein